MTATTRPTNILLIEDNPGDAQLVRIYMEDAAMQHHIFHADTFFEGLQLIQQYPIDLALLDLSLPDTTGFKTLNKYLETVFDVPVIVLTGTNNEIVGNQAVKAGAEDFLVKGQFDGKLLGRVIRYSIQRFQTRKQLETTNQTLTLQGKRTLHSQQVAGFGHWEMDLVSGKMTWADEMYGIVGLPLGSGGAGLSDYLALAHPEEKILVAQFFEQAGKDGQSHKLEHRIVNGTQIRYVELQAKIYYEEWTQKILLVGSVQDITERKQTEQLNAEQNIKRQNALLKEQVLSDIGFHIRTPMAASANLLYLLQQSDLNANQRELVQGLTAATQDLEVVIRQLLNFSTLISSQLVSQLEEVRSEKWLQEVEKWVQLQTLQITQNLIFAVENRENLPQRIVLDKEKINQVIQNLLQYAQKSSVEGGKIQLNMAVSDSQLTIKLLQEGKPYSLTQLQEMSEERKILEKIGGDQKDFLNRGLDLAIVAKLAKTMNSNLKIDFKGKNTLFSLTFGVKTIRINTQNLQLPERPLRILLVEDHFLNQMATRKLLTTWSPLVSVDIAENGLVAIEKVRSYAYDMVLMDLQMPIMNGLEATRKIREDYTNLPIIALTAHESHSEAAECRTLGMNDYLSKPFQPQELFHKMMALI